MVSCSKRRIGISQWPFDVVGNRELRGYMQLSNGRLLLKCMKGDNAFDELLLHPGYLSV